MFHYENLIYLVLLLLALLVQEENSCMLYSLSKIILIQDSIQWCLRTLLKKFECKSMAKRNPVLGPFWHYDKLQICTVEL